MTAGYQYIGYNGTGLFTQSGGTNAGTLYLGTYAGQRLLLHERPGCHFRAQNTSAMPARAASPSWAAPTRFDLYVGYNSGGSGVYSLGGTGQLSATNEYVGYNSAA